MELPQFYLSLIKIVFSRFGEEGADGEEEREAYSLLSTESYAGLDLTTLIS